MIRWIPVVLDETPRGIPIETEACYVSDLVRDMNAHHRSVMRILRRYWERVPEEQVWEGGIWVTKDQAMLIRCILEEWRWHHNGKVVIHYDFTVIGKSDGTCHNTL